MRRCNDQKMYVALIAVYCFIQKATSYDVGDTIKHEPGYCVEQEPCGYNGYLDNGQSRGIYLSQIY